MININYDINNALFPFDFAIQHFRAIPQEAEWEGRIVHLILGVLELIFPINYIIAVFERIIVTEQQLQRQPPGPPGPPVHPLPPPRPPAAKVLDATQAKEARELLQAALLGLVGGLQFGLTEKPRHIGKDIEMLALRGIHTVEDLYALGIFEWDHKLQTVGSFKLGLVPQVQADDAFLADEIKTLAGLEKRANPDRAAKDFDARNIMGVRTKLLEITETLQEHVAGALKEQAAGYSLDEWNRINRGLERVTAALEKPKNKLIDELNALREVVASIQQEEPKRQQALTNFEHLELYWNRFKGHVGTVTEHVASVQEVINELFYEAQYGDAEAGIVKDLKASYQQQLAALEEITTALKEFDARSLPHQLHRFQEVLQTLESYSRLESVGLLRLYVSQVNATVAWKTINGQDIPGVAALKMINRDVDLFHLAQVYS